MIRVDKKYPSDLLRYLSDEIFFFNGATKMVNTIGSVADPDNCDRSKKMIKKAKHYYFAIAGEGSTPLTANTAIMAPFPFLLVFHVSVCQVDTVQSSTQER